AGGMEPEGRHDSPTDWRAAADDARQKPLSEAVDGTQGEAENGQLHHQLPHRLAEGPRTFGWRTAAECERHPGPDHHPHPRRRNQPAPRFVQVAAELAEKEAEEEDSREDQRGTADRS